MKRSSSLVTDAQSRKARRKEERLKKKTRHGKRSPHDPEDEEDRPSSKKRQPEKKKKRPQASTASKDEKKNKNAKTKSSGSSAKKKKDPYANLDPDVAAALRRDDDEIAAIEAKLGLGAKKEKARLKREYAKLEGFGDDFGDFLDDLDGLVDRVSSSSSAGPTPTTTTTGAYQTLLEDEDDEDDEDNETDHNSSSEEEEEDIDDQIVSMKDPVYDSLDEDDSVMDEIEAREQEDHDVKDTGDGEDTGSDDEGEQSDDAESAEDEDGEEPDHDSSLTYRPSQGEDIYGNRSDQSTAQNDKSKYVPPHMRKMNLEEGGRDDRDNQRREESLRDIQRSLNGALNRLSEDTLVSVSQSIARLYADGNHPSSDVNECVWKNTRSACVARAVQMTGLIPVYVAALAGVHVQKGDAAQLGEFVAEAVVSDLWTELESARAAAGQSSERQQQASTEITGNDEPAAVSKEACNLTLILCYLYNLGIVHCSLMYDIIRELIKHFREVDVEILLLILSHSGRTLRSDDPSSLKEIVLLVQKRALESTDGSLSVTSSRVDFMVSAMMDLKNNKKRKQDVAFAENNAKLRKMVGKIKSMVATGNSNVRASDSSLRITLNDILNAETNGRWWRVGASWVGNQNQYQGDAVEVAERKSPNAATRNKKASSATTTGEEDEKLLKLAAKYRMNTDVRRSIFCIVMGSADCDDSFEKLVRAGLLKNRKERETVRVLMECCGNEKSYNKYYSHFASRLCEFQPQCKFSFQLAFWDAFKQFDEMKLRKIGNLAKLLFHLVAVHQHLKLDVLKAIDMASPDDLPETALIFLTIFLSSILEHFDDKVAVSKLFKHGISQRRRKAETEDEDDVLDHVDEGDALRANLTVFFVQILKSSPKYTKKGSRFRSNLKAAIRACDTENFFLD